VVKLALVRANPCVTFDCYTAGSLRSDSETCFALFCYELLALANLDF